MRNMLSIAIILGMGIGNCRAENPTCGEYLHLWWLNLFNPAWSCRQPCADDYCVKPFPKYDPRAKCGVDNYCYKPFPHLDPRAGCGPDTYEGKCMPRIEPLCNYPPYYLCAPCNRKSAGQEVTPAHPCTAGAKCKNP